MDSSGGSWCAVRPALARRSCARSACRPDCCSFSAHTSSAHIQDQLTARRGRRQGRPSTEAGSHRPACTSQNDMRRRFQAILRPACRRTAYARAHASANADLPALLQRVQHAKVRYLRKTGKIPPKLVDKLDVFVLQYQLVMSMGVDVFMLDATEAIPAVVVVSVAAVGRLVDPPHVNPHRSANA